MCSNFETADADKLAALCGRFRPEFAYSKECFPGGDSPIIVRDDQGHLMAPENHEELRGLLNLFDAESYEAWPKAKVTKPKAAE